MQHRSMPQHMEALQRANHVRLTRWRVRRAVRDRRVSLLALLELALPERELELIAPDVPLADVLTWGHRIGESVARRVMLRAEITPTPSLRLAHLSAPRRAALVAAALEIAPHACQGAREPDAVATVLDAMRTEESAATASEDGAPPGELAAA